MSLGPPAASAPSEPVIVALALYRPSPRTRCRPSRSFASIACSSEVNGPDSTTSLDMAPHNDKRHKRRSEVVVAYTNPVAARIR